MIDMLKRLSPVPIEFVGDTGTFYGRYCHDGCYEEHPCIKIVDNLGNHEEIAVLAHEIGHAICFEKHCECETSKNYTQREIHAFEYSLKWLLENKQKESLKWSIKIMKIFLSRYDHYADVAKHIVKIELWQKCLDYVK